MKRPKQIKQFALAIPLALLLGGTVALATPSARVDSVPAMRVEPPASYKGQFLTTMYVIGSKQPIALDDRQIYISEVKKIVPSIRVDSTVEIPSVQIPKEGFRPTYNLIVFVFHKQPDFYWVNADGQYAADPRMPDSNLSRTIRPEDAEPLRVISISKSEFEQQAAQQGNPEKVSLRLF